MEILQIVLTVLSCFISLCTVITLMYGFGKFLSKPHETLEQRVSTIEQQLRDINRDKDNLKERCNEQDETNEVLIHSTLALIEFEIQYCLTEKKPLSDDLKKAKKDLHDYLAKK